VAMYNLASTYHEQSRHSEAESLQMQVLEGMELHLGEAHPNTLLAMGSLAATYYSQTRYAESATLLVRALELHEGRGTCQVAKCAYNLSWTYYHLGQLTEAMDMALKAEQMEKNLLGVEHPGYKVIIELVNFLRRSSRVVKKRGPRAIK
jgi:tetratricopeptide (TPR) repeat protein